jgi:hypothetical protein
MKQLARITCPFYSSLRNRNLYVTLAWNTYAALDQVHGFGYSHQNAEDILMKAYEPVIYSFKSMPKYILVACIRTNRIKHIITFTIFVAIKLHEVKDHLTV